MTHENNLVVDYRIDRNDRIIEVGEQWDDFANANEGEGLKPADVVGTSLWWHIRGNNTTRLYEAICEHVRQNQQATSFPFRCDSPSVSRLMRMTISAERDGSLLFSSMLVREEPNLHNAVFLHNPSSAPQLILRCSMCNRIRLDNRWDDPTRAMNSSELFTLSNPIQVAYSICGDCDARIGRKLLRRGDPSDKS